MPQIIFANRLPDSLSDAIMYIPVGKHEIECSVNGKPGKIVSNVPPEKGEQIAAALQADLDRRLKANVRPVFDFDHKNDGPASGLPQRFFYEKGVGIMVEAEWTGAGRKAREDKDYSYFSPTYFRSDKTGEPVGLPERGPLGALVNDPAFREIQRVAAAQAEPEPNPTNTNTMNSLVTAGILTEAEAALPNAETIAASRVTTLQTESAKVEAAEKKVTVLTKERDDLKKEMDEVKASQAHDTIKQAIKAGRILAKDEETQAYWKNQLIASPVEAKKALDAIKPANGDLTDAVIVDAGGSNQSATGEHKLVTAARQMVEAGTCKDEDEAIAEVAQRSPELYADYCQSLGNEG